MQSLNIARFLQKWHCLRKSVNTIDARLTKRENSVIPTG